MKIIFPGENDDYKKEIIDFAIKCNLLSKIVFPGYVNGVDYLSITDLVVLPSIHEGYPVSCVEAFCMGVPVVRTIAGGYEDTKAYCSGVRYGDVDALTNTLDAFFNREIVFSQKANAALKNKDKFSIKTMADKYADLYSRVLQK